MSGAVVMETEIPRAGSGAERIVELLLEIHDAHVVGLKALHGAGKQTALKTADERLTELAALLLPAVAVVMGEDYDQLGEDDEVTARAVSVTPASARGAAQNARERWCRRQRCVRLRLPRGRVGRSLPAVGPLPFSLQQQDT